MKNVFLICPVRHATEEERSGISKYIKTLESEGYKIYYPARDTDQTDSIGINIITTNLGAILASDEVHLFYSETSQASLIDFGFAYGNKKPIYIVNKNRIKPSIGKSYQNVLLHLNELYQPNLTKREEWKKLDEIVKELNV